MNKLIVIAALALAGSPAFASKARVNALANSAQLVDVQNTFEKPQMLHSVGEMATIEWGDKGDSANPHAEGGFIKKGGDSVYGLYFGRKSADFSNGVSQFNANNGAGNDVLAEQNPINLMYASKMNDMSWGVNVKYSNGKDEGTNDQKVSSMGVAAGLTNGTWDANLVLGLTGKSEATGSTLESKGNTKVGFGYNLSDMMYAYADFKTTKSEGTVATTTTTVETTDIHVGFVNTLVKNDDANFFYGIAYSSEVVKDSTETTTLPVWMGIEANATSWMVLRASVKQSVLINTVDNKSTSKKSDLDSIAFNAGAGLKLGKGMLDMSFGTANTGKFDYANGQGNFLTQAAYTYMF